MSAYILITGASTGYGKALAIECAKQNYNLVLVALPESNLANLGSFLSANFGIQVMTFELDLGSVENCKLLFKKIKAHGITIKYLINNAGVLSNGLFEDLSEDYFLKQIDVNITTPTMLTKLFIDDFKNSAPAGILNVSSLASFFNLPKKQVYGGTKAYLLAFSKSLQKELRHYGIWISVVCPGGMSTTTKLCLQNRRLKWVARQSILDPEKAAKYTLKQFFKKHQLIVPGRINRLFMFLNSLIPEKVQSRLTRNAI